MPEEFRSIAAVGIPRVIPKATRLSFRTVVTWVCAACHPSAQLLSAAALAEFRAGGAERGRAIFEGILRNYPKRLDLWSVYLDQARARTALLCWDSRRGLF